MSARFLKVNGGTRLVLCVVSLEKSAVTQGKVDETQLINELNVREETRGQGGQGDESHWLTMHKRRQDP